MCIRRFLGVCDLGEGAAPEDSAECIDLLCIDPLVCGVACEYQHGSGTGGVELTCWAHRACKPSKATP